MSSAVVAVVACLNFFIVSVHDVRAASGALLLGEVQTAGVGDSNREFIEIYNTDPNPGNTADSAAVPIPATFLTFGASVLALAMSRMRIGF